MTRLLRNFSGLAIAAALAIPLFHTFIDSGLQVKAAGRSYAGTAAAPEFPGDLDWINTNGERLTWQRLRGKVVLLDFWTYGCINCMHVIPDLKRLEEKYGDRLVVIGVHTAKFAAEGNTRRIRSIVARYERQHPVVNDRNYYLWNRFQVQAWPTLTVIDPLGKVTGSVAGEGHYELLDEVIGSLLTEFADQIDATPLGFEPDFKDDPDSILRFPGKVLADEAKQQLFIADTNHHRILVTDFDGAIKTIIGNGQAGFADGTFAMAQFRQPQGMAWDGERYLYVADTENHALRQIDFRSGTVRSLAGNGRQQYLSRDEYPAKGTGLNSPWDVLLQGDSLYIAMAGQHQLWRYDFLRGEIEVFAGTRREALTDGPRLLGALNQPSGLASDGENIYFADAEASAIRFAEPGLTGQLETLVGTGLFDFGDRDGQGERVLLQHPLGVAYRSGKLYIADTYNDKIKLLDIENRTVRTLTGGADKLSEPGGLSLAGERLFIADTNQHAIKVLNLVDNSLSTLNIHINTD